MSYTSNQLAFNLPTRQHCRKNVNAKGQIPGADFTSKEAIKIAKIYFRTMHKKRWSIPTQARKRKWRRESSTDCWRPCAECDANMSQWTVVKNFDRHPRLAAWGLEVRFILFAWQTAKAHRKVAWCTSRVRSVLQRQSEVTC